MSKQRPEKVEPLADTIHTWMEANDSDALAFFECIGGPRDGLTLAAVWDRKQATAIRDFLDRWLAEGA